MQDYIERLQYALQSESVVINFQKNRRADERRDREYTNRYTISYLFPDEDEVEVLKRELASLTVEEYIETVQDLKFPRDPRCEFLGKNIQGKMYTSKLE